jgi:hypothetical protein
MSVPRGQMVTGLALSADGAKLAIAVQLDNVQNEPNLQEVRVYTLATGTVRTWLSNGTIGSGPDDARSLSWTADGRTLAFDWIGNNAGRIVVRLLDLSAPGSDLLANSKLATTLTSPEQEVPLPGSSPSRPSSAATLFPHISASPVSGATGTATLPTPPPLACQEDSIVTPDGSAVVCGAIGEINATFTTTGALKRGAETGFFEYSTANGNVRHVLGRWTFGNVGALATDVLWSNTSGSLLIAVIPTAGDGRVGVIRGNEFTPIPAQAASAPASSGAW